MVAKAVLVIGLDPEFADFSQFPQLTPALIRDYIDRQIAGLRDLGYDAESCWVGRGEAAEAAVAAALSRKRFDCVVIGAGLREPPKWLLLFERILNLVHERAPKARIAFNTNPADTAEAVRRWLG
jgi:hypothetical protein